MDRKRHWEKVYSEQQTQEASWHQDLPRLSLAMIENAGVSRDAALIDVGGGPSLLVDHLLDRGYHDLTVLDLSATALEQARLRLGERAARVRWMEADVTRFQPDRGYRLWHDRAAFHFLTGESDRVKYVEALCNALEDGGHAVIAAFSPEGPSRCSGLDVVRYDAQGMSAELGSDFILEEERAETHFTPAGREQAFRFYRFRRAG